MPISNGSTFDRLLAQVPAGEEFHEPATLAASDPRQAGEMILVGYFALSNALGRLLHGDEGVPENATFPTFAAWSTETLRSETDRRAGDADAAPPHRFTRPGRRIYRRVAREVLGDDDVIARNIARGEAAIFEEIGPAIRALLDTAAEGLHPLDALDDYRSLDWPEIWAASTGRFTGALTALNDRRRDPEEPEGVGPGDAAVLQRAVRAYVEVLRTGLSLRDIDAAQRKGRAELVLLGNLRFEAYAQKRLEPVLERNLGYIPDAVRARVGSRVASRPTLSARVLRRVYERSGAVAETFDEAFQIAATRHVYSVVIGDEELGFGRDLPLPPPANPVLRDRQPEPDRNRYGAGYFFPYDLQTLENRATWAAWQQYDRSTGDGSRTAVDNWLRYEERLNYIANLLRSRQQLRALYDRPRSMPPPALPPRPAQLGTVADALSDATGDRLADKVGGRS